MLTLGVGTIAYVAMIFLPSSSECPSSAGEPSERRCGSNTHFPSGGASIMESAIIRVTVTLAVPLLFWKNTFFELGSQHSVVDIDKKLPGRICRDVGYERPVRLDFICGFTIEFRLLEVLSGR
jgi:hypothetical protein